MISYDTAVLAIIGFAAAVILQAALLSKAKNRIVRLLPAIVSAAAALISALAAVIMFMTLGQDAAAKNVYIFILAAIFFGAALLGCGIAAASSALMKTRAAVIVPIAAAAIALCSVFAAEWAGGSYQHKWDLRVYVDEISASENGDLNIRASGIWDDPAEASAYSLTVPKKLAEKYNLFEGMTLSCDVKASDGKTTVTKIEKLYKK